MTNVTIFRSDGRMFGFEAKGHTGYAHQGEDIVCSAVSALTQTAVLGLREYLKLPLAQDMADGHLYCMLSADIDETMLAKAEIILETMAMGLSDIAQMYPRFLKITERQV